MSKNIMENLFGSKTRVKVLKFLFRNYPNEFSAKYLAGRIQEPKEVIKKEIETLRIAGLIRKKNSTDKENYSLNPDFEFFVELKTLILKSSPAEKDRMIRRISNLGRIRLAVTSGIFLNYIDNGAAVADLVIVGNDIDRTRLRKFLKSLEAEVGAEIRFTLMDKEEFGYRYGMFDRFVRVLLEGPHEKIINKIGI